MKFRFPFEKLLNHKKVERDLAYRSFVEAQTILEDAKHLLKTMYQELDDARVYNVEVLRKSGNVEDIKWSDHFIEGQEVVIVRHKEKIRKLQTEVEIRQEALAEKAKEFKMYEKLREKMKERHKKAEKKHELKVNDEIVVMSSYRRSQGE